MPLRLLAIALCATLAAAWSPRPPCTAPPGITAPAVDECMCSLEVARKGDVAVRQMGSPANETLVSGAFFAPQWPVAIGYGVSSLLDYFVSGDNVPGVKMPGARTAPVTFRQRAFPNGTVYEWVSAMMVSTAAFPDTSAIPAPVDPIKLERVGARLVAVRQFTTSSLPTELDFNEACAGITADTLPPGFAVDTQSAWSPTFVLYSAEKTTMWENECWLEVLAG